MILTMFNDLIKFNRTHLNSFHDENSLVYELSVSGFRIGDLI